MKASTRRRRITGYFKKRVFTYFLKKIIKGIAWGSMLKSSDFRLIHQNLATKFFAAVDVVQPLRLSLPSGKPTGAFNRSDSSSYELEGYKGPNPNNTIQMERGAKEMENRFSTTEKYGVAYETMLKREAESYSVALWCKNTTFPAGPLVKCPTATRQKHALNKYIFKGTENDVPYLGFTMRRVLDDRPGKPCEVDMFLQFMRCETCCCVNGLVMADKRVVLRETDTEGVCADWYYLVDAIAGVSTSLLRGTLSNREMYNFFGRCVVKGK